MDYMKLADTIMKMRAAGGDTNTLDDLVQAINFDFKDDPNFDRQHFYRAAMGPA